MSDALVLGEGVPCWVDAVLPDLTAGRAFYGELFGWTFEDQGEDVGHYTLAFRDGKAAAGVMPAPDPSAPTAWTVYFASDDAAQAAARIAEAGGQVLFGPDAAGESGAMVGAADPGGSLFGVWEAGGLLGFGITDEPGTFCWTENHTRDAAAIDAFYDTLFGYRAEQIGDGREFDYKVWSLPADPHRRFGGRMALGAGAPQGQRPAFQVYFAVADCDTAATAVRDLGGTVVREPRDSPAGRLAVVTDDQGAGFTIIDPTRKIGLVTGS